MEIRILSAGKQIGPYPEAQVRQYLSEGLISAADPAYAEGMGEWMPTGQLLTRLASRESVPTGNGKAQANVQTLRAVTVRSTTALPRVKRGPIQIQPLFVPETESVRRARTGKITIEAPRPTTQLPPIAKFVPREERSLPRNTVETGQLSPAYFFDRYPPVPQHEPQPNAPTTLPEPEEDLLTAAEPPLASEPDIAPEEEIALEPEPEEGQNARGVPDTLYAIWYTSLLIGAVALALLLGVIYVMWYYDQPAPHQVQTSAPLAPLIISIPDSPQTAADYSARGFAGTKKATSTAPWPITTRQSSSTRTTSRR